MTELSEIYKLLIYLKLKDQIHLVQEYVGEDITELESIAQDHLRANTSYVAVVTTFRLVNARVVA